MYTFLINEDNTLIPTQTQRIMHRSKMVDDLRFLTNKFYNGFDMSTFTVCLEYVLPVSKKYRTEFLLLSNEMYNKDYIEYKLPFDTKLTSEPGDIEIQVSFIISDLSDNGKSIQRVRKISPSKISILPVSSWSDIIPDESLFALDQRIIKMDSQIKAIELIGEQINTTKADNLTYSPENNVLQLMADGNTIGDPVSIANCNIDKDGIPIVEFYGKSEEPELVDVVIF